MEDFVEIRRKLNIFLLSINKYLSNNEVDDIQESIDAGEWGLAFETITTQICEYKIPIPICVYKDLVEFGESIGVDSSYWLDLKDYIVK